MDLQQLRDRFTDPSRDIKVNLGNIVTEDHAPGLSRSQIAGTALACAYALKSPDLISALGAEFKEEITEEIRFAAEAAASIMAMNNVYYRFIHLADEPALNDLPAKLRMTVIGRPGVEKVDFELYSLAVSAINGCGNCIKSHVQQALSAGISAEGAQSAGRIAAVLTASHQALFNASVSS